MKFKINNNNTHRDGPYYSAFPRIFVLFAVSCFFFFFGFFTHIVTYIWLSLSWEKSTSTLMGTGSQLIFLRDLSSRHSLEVRSVPVLLGRARIKRLCRIFVRNTLCKISSNMDCDTPFSSLTLDVWYPFYSDGRVLNGLAEMFL